MQWNEMKDGRVQILERKRLKERFWQKLQEMVECNDMKDNREQVLRQKGWKWWKQRLGWEFA